MDHYPFQVGQTWRWTSPEDASIKESMEYVIEAVTENYLRLAAVDDHSYSPNQYPINDFLMGYEKGHWTYERVGEEICQKCETRMRADDDYLCKECRYG